MLFSRELISKISPRLRSAVLNLERSTKIDFSISIPPKAELKHGLSTIVQINTRVNNAKPSKPTAELNAAAKAVAEAKSTWYAYDKGCFKLAEEQTKKGTKED